MVVEGGIEVCCAAQRNLALLQFRSRLEKWVRGGGWNSEAGSGRHTLGCKFAHLRKNSACISAPKLPIPSAPSVRTAFPRPALSLAGPLRPLLSPADLYDESGEFLPARDLSNGDQNQILVRLAQHELGEGWVGVGVG